MLCKWVKKNKTVYTHLGEMFFSSDNITSSMWCGTVSNYCKNIYSKSVLYIIRNTENILSFSNESSDDRCSLDIADLDWGSNSKAWIDRLNKCGLKPVQEGHGAANAIKCQHTCSVVQVHAYPGGVGAVDGFVHAVVPGRVTWVRTQ